MRRWDQAPLREIDLKALVFTRDRKLAAKFARAIADVPINWVLVDDRVLPAKLISDERFDLLVLDCASRIGRSLLSQARETLVNHKCVIIAEGAKDSIHATLNAFADVYVHRADDADVLAECIRELLPLMKEQRRGPRCPLNTELLVRHRRGTSVATALMLSEGGMMMRTEEAISNFEILSIQLTLPCDTEKMNLHGKIVWSAPTGLVGLRFLGTSKADKAKLTEWVFKEPYFLHANA